MFARIGRLVGNAFGYIFYWVGWALAVLLIGQAIILSVASGAAVVPILLGIAGLAIWLIGLAFNYVMARR
jgi:steroid 5-alpha reductase family enzyme